eukprot:TRINITY_DN28480_c0_g1_i1.p1 TRINITY_DN28480_c0_g1~~TRINITY_DN28480_c0_g1_i1.p1  ORF type:complete len:483 (+),score=134.55 TRINITY_DN28480_c0_g1_i1:65-1513(+)
MAWLDSILSALSGSSESKLPAGGKQKRTSVGAATPKASSKKAEDAAATAKFSPPRAPPGPTVPPTTEQVPKTPACMQQSKRPEVVTLDNLVDAGDRVAKAASPFGSGGFTNVRRLQEALRNHGSVELMKTNVGKDVAVKIMPTHWVRESPGDFRKHHPLASEQPWLDIGLVKLMNESKFPYVCEQLGVFRDEDYTYVVSSFCTEGDLFSWCDIAPFPGASREAVLKPLANQLFEAVTYLHKRGIAHRDISLENVLLTKSKDASDSSLALRVIDFGMATTSRWCRKEVRGKQSYQAPEMHGPEYYDAFLVDSFALGVTLFAASVQDYPWISTKKDGCQLFEFVSTFGFKKLLEKRKLRKGTGEKLVDVLSAELAELVEGLVQLDADKRWALGESCFVKEAAVGKPVKPSAWDASWMGCAGVKKKCTDIWETGSENCDTNCIVAHEGESCLTGYPKKMICQSLISCPHPSPRSATGRRLVIQSL